MVFINSYNAQQWLLLNRTLFPGPGPGLYICNKSSMFIKNENPNAPVAAWLFICAGLVFAMVVVGAITRLSDAGLSMVEWRPLMGVLPPLGEGEWQRVFELYKASPEYQKKHFWMELQDFKLIFFWEWFHRFLGRLIGLAYALPLALFWLKGMIPVGYKTKLMGLFALGGLQGLMGWYMVQSGLIDEPAVSHYRLAAHLGLAFIIFALLLHFGLSLGEKKQKSSLQDRTLAFHTLILTVIYICTVIWGAFTAGLDAGLIYNQNFPKMNGGWIPPNFWALEPGGLNLFENHGTVQFIHRWLAVLTVLAGLALWVHAALKKSDFPALRTLAVLLVLQAGLGISTLLSQVALPLAVLHQAGALLVLTALVMTLRRLRF